MIESRQRFVVAAVLTAAAGLGACGFGLIDFGGGGSHKGAVIVKGNLDLVLPVTTRDIVVFVFSGKDPSGSDCPAASTTTSTTIASAAAESANAQVDGGAAAGSGSCECPAAPVHPECTPGDAVVLTSGQKTFNVGGVDSGKIRVVFLLDNAGSSADGQIDAGDPIAILDDINCQLDDVGGNRTVTLTDVDLQFDAAPVSECQDGVNNPPAAGRARALTIAQEKTPSES
ncbi:MAG: hypothetical protein HY899_12885 [Deltaproteobacteria bacterium]|nr:hypothetical protein [Deltaproteobacteria bacterium]